MSETSLRTPVEGGEPEEQGEPGQGVGGGNEDEEIKGRCTYQISKIDVLSYS